MRGEKPTFWGLAILEGDHWLASFYGPGPKTLFVVPGTHRDKPTSRDIENQVAFGGKSDQRIFG